MSHPVRSIGRILTLSVAAAAGIIAAVAGVSPASAATTTLYAAPAGTGTACSAAQPCSLTAAQAAVRSINGSMIDDIVVQLADSGRNIWRANVGTGIANGTKIQLWACTGGNNQKWALRS